MSNPAKQFFSVAEWEPKSHTIGVVKITKTGKTAPLLYPNTSRFYLSTGKLSSPFGVTCSSDWANKDNDSSTTSASASASTTGGLTADKYSISLSLNEGDSNGLKSKLLDLDEHIIDLSCTEKLDKVTGLPELYIVKASGGRKVDASQYRSVAENKYSTSVKYPKDQTSSYPPRFTANIKTNPKNPSEIETEFYDKAGKRIEGVSLDPTSSMYIKHVIPRNSQCNLLVDGYIWSIDSASFGIKWSIKQLRVYPAQEVIPLGVCMIGNDEVDEDNTDTTTKTGLTGQTEPASKTGLAGLTNHSTATGTNGTNGTNGLCADPVNLDDDEELFEDDQPLN